MALTIHWPQRAEQSWLLLSERAQGPARVIEYRRRMRIEETFQNCKRRGWNREASKMAELACVDRLWLAVFIRLWWMELLGLQVIRRGLRQRYDRAGRRDLSVVPLGHRWMKELLRRAQPPLPFRFHTSI